MRKKVLIAVALFCLLFGPGKGYCAGNIQINAHDVPLRTVLEGLGRSAGMNILIDDSVKGNITVYLHNVSAQEALQSVIHEAGLCLEEKNGIFLIEGTGEGQKTVSETVPLSYMKAADAAGVAGADANADTPRYTTQNGNNNANDGYANSSATREWLYNVLKEQKEISPGVLEDATVAVVINTDDTSIPERDLINLVADASGITREEAGDKITILRSLNKTNVQKTEEEKTDTEKQTVLSRFPLWALIGAAVSAFLLLLILILLILRAKKRKKLKMLMEEEKANQEALSVKPSDEIAPIDDTPDEYELNAEGRMIHGMKLKKSIGEFADQNPQVVAKLIQSWMREEEQNLGRKQHRSTRKTS